MWFVIERVFFSGKNPIDPYKSVNSILYRYKSYAITYRNNTCIYILYLPTRRDQRGRLATMLLSYVRLLLHNIMRLLKNLILYYIKIKYWVTNRDINLLLTCNLTSSQKLRLIKLLSSIFYVSRIHAFLMANWSAVYDSWHACRLMVSALDWVIDLQQDLLFNSIFNLYGSFILF